MESLGGIGFSNTSSATKKKRSTTLRRPWNDRQLQDSSSLPSTPVADNVRNQKHINLCNEKFILLLVRIVFGVGIVFILL